MSIRSDIMSRMAYLPRSAQRVGRTVVTESATVASLNIAELAYLCDTDEASVIRFCHSVGFAGYGDLREALQHELESAREHKAVS
ncbi:MAG: hypothetical protein Q4F67_02225 [Propionibacteriaceae bacterium]|nr:hypothetical protein [Propionibacteriaceae bacterium]